MALAVVTEGDAVHPEPAVIPTAVTGNLKPNAVLKLAAFDLDGLLDTEIGGFASDDHHRPALVTIAQKRAQAKYGMVFTRSNTVIIGDSLDDRFQGIAARMQVPVSGGGSLIGVAARWRLRHRSGMRGGCPQ
ncbi:hypothetical protein [Streptomyces sp. H27-S2]|uniref:hypothetical protein n=1 Tax=Streptomyces antarcticus TaxID=2996458 RepID=UPI002D1E3CDE|nr:hypothetical protein [Streptomyces sp. H27-S2]